MSMYCSKNVAEKQSNKFLRLELQSFKIIKQSCNGIVCFVSKVFPHPNYHIEMGKSDQPVFLESFPEVKLELNQWARSNITNLNCENIGIELKQNILPKTYQTYLQEFQPNNHQLSYADFLRLWHLKSISESTVWR